MRLLEELERQRFGLLPVLDFELDPGVALLRLELDLLNPLRRCHADRFGQAPFALKCDLLCRQLGLLARLGGLLRPIQRLPIALLISLEALIPDLSCLEPGITLDLALFRPQVSLGFSARLGNPQGSLCLHLTQYLSLA